MYLAKIDDYILLKNELINCKSYCEKIDAIQKRFGLKDSESVLRQVDASLGVLDSFNNEYLMLFNYLLDNGYDLNGNILEIGGGFYPVLATYIDEYQRKQKCKRRLNCGTITVIDPNLGVTSLGNIILKKDSFSYGCDISGYDLIIAQSPCLLTHDVLNSAIDNGKEFFVTLCKCLIDKYPYLVDFDSDDFGFCNVQNDILVEKRKRNNNLIFGRDLFIDSGSIFYDKNFSMEMKYISGKKLIKK